MSGRNARVPGLCLAARAMLFSHTPHSTCPRTLARVRGMRFPVMLLSVWVLASVGVLGTGRKHLRPGTDPLAKLAREREDAKRQASL